MRWVRTTLASVQAPEVLRAIGGATPVVIMPSADADEMLRLITELSNRISCKCDPLTKRKCLKCQARAFLSTHAEANRGEGG